MNLWIQQWYESREFLGPGDDGFSVHRTLNDLEAFTNALRARDREHWGERVPEEYLREDGRPYLAEVTNDAIIGEVMASAHGVMCWSEDYPVPSPVHPGLQGEFKRAPHWAARVIHWLSRRGSPE